MAAKITTIPACDYSEKIFMKNKSFFEKAC